MQYMPFSGGINGDCASKYKKNNQIYLLTECIKRLLWGVAVRLSYIYIYMVPKV